MANSQTELTLTYGDYGLGVQATDCAYLFSHAAQGLSSLKVAGREWLYRPLRPVFWRATTDNDRGNGFSNKAAMWLGADLFTQGTLTAVRVDNQPIALPVGLANNAHHSATRARAITLVYRYHTATTPSTIVELTYTVTPAALTVRAHYYGLIGLPELPVFGVQLICPTPASGYQYAGLTGETYPDRLGDQQPGVFAISGQPVTPYLVPQDCGVHMHTDWVTITRQTTLDNRHPEVAPFALTLTKRKAPFAFSCLPYTAAELENATHQEELPPARRCVVTVMGAVRGVGGIDSWGADVEAAYHLPGDVDVDFEFAIHPGVVQL